MIRPIDFQGMIFNVQRVEKVQANKVEHNFVIQEHIAKEIREQRRERMRRVVETEQGGELRVDDRSRKREERRGTKKWKFYGKDRKLHSQGEGELLDKEA